MRDKVFIGMHISASWNSMFCTGFARDLRVMVPYVTRKLCSLGVCLTILLSLSACATRRLPKFEKPLKRAEYQTVRTTAYTHTEADHRRHGTKSALGTPLQTGEVNSAAADWSRWPAGTVFQIEGSDQLYQIDDYGWALSGRNTIDIYMPSRAAMNAWGVRTVKIHILEWGDVQHSYTVLKPRRKHPHVKRMLKQIEDRY